MSSEWLAGRFLQVDASTVFDGVQKFTPLYQDAAKARRHRVGQRWSVDETHVKVAGRRGYVCRAMDEHGQVVEVLFREQRDTEAAVAFFRSALESTGVTPHTVTTEKAAVYPPALTQVLPAVEPITGKAVQQRIERDHRHLKGRLKIFRGCKTRGGAQRFCRAHGFIRNLHQGFYRLGAVLRNTNEAIRPQLARAWEELTAQLPVAQPRPRQAPRVCRRVPAPQSSLVPACPNKTVLGMDFHHSKSLFLKFATESSSMPSITQAAPAF